MGEQSGFNPDAPRDTESMQRELEEVLKLHLDKLGPGREYSKDPKLVAEMIKDLKNDKIFLQELNAAVEEQEVEAVQ